MAYLPSFHTNRLLCMFTHAFAKQCRACALAYTHSQAIVAGKSINTNPARNLAVSARWARQPKGRTASKADTRRRNTGQHEKKPSTPSLGRGVRRAFRSRDDASSYIRPPPRSAFKLSSEVPDVSGEDALDRKAILEALRSRQKELSGTEDEASPGERRMIPIIAAVARRLALDKAELLDLAKQWAGSVEFPAKIDSKGKGRQTPGLESPDGFDISDVERDMVIYGERAIERAVLSHFLRWIRNEDIQERLGVSLQLGAIAEALDLRFPGEWFPMARNMSRKIILHVGPTNSGKTYNALCALAKARTGAFGGPLRLLAAEVYNRFNAGTIGGLTPDNPRMCNLITGEEKKIHDELCGLQSCTVEMMSLNRLYDVVVIDEIQMIADPGRGSAWTQALLGLRAKEIHLCGEPSVVELIKRIGKSLGDEVEVKTYERLSPLTVASKSIRGDYKHIQRGDCVVAFSRTGIFNIKEIIERETGLRVAVAYGGLPPEVREEQARGFNAPESEGGYDVLVASDAIGMGLNLQIRRVIFTTLKKWDGRQEVPLSVSQIKQIGGRAGRYGMGGKNSSPSAPDADEPSAAPIVEDEAQLNGVVTCLEESDMPFLRQAMSAPMEPIHRAALHPLPTQLEKFATLLPDSTTQAHVFEIFPVIAAFSPDYFIPSFGNSLKLAEKLANIPRLTISERWLLGNAPVNLRDEESIRAFQTFVEHFSIDESLRVTQWINAQRMSTALEKFRDVEDALNALKEDGLDEKHETAERDKGDVGSGSHRTDRPAVLPPEAQDFVSNSNLVELESLHRCLGMYLWLHNRYPLRFPQAAEARLFKGEVQNAIDFILQHMSPDMTQAKSKRDARNLAKKVGRRR